MDEDRPHVSGFFANRDDAGSTLSKLVERVAPRERLQIFETDTAMPASAPRSHSNAVLNGNYKHSGTT